MHTLSFLSVLAVVNTAFAATAEQWRGRSIYQIITDRYALPAGADTTTCDPGAQTWCGGTWNTIRENLDYIQDAGFTAVWISPVSQNYEGPRSTYGDPYHGYWIQDVSQLNARFGTAADLKALSAALHSRGMYLMVDVVVNNVMATSLPPSGDAQDYYSNYLFKDPAQYHTYCPIDWSNSTSEEFCWLGDTKVPLPDVNTQDPTVVSTYSSWIKDLVQTYDIDGLRIDAAKHVNMDFWPPFCEAAGVFCIGEVFQSDVAQAAEWQGQDSLDSILNYPMYNALVQAFQIPGPNNVSAIADAMAQSKDKFTDVGLLGNFLENQDLPRWGNISSDPQSLYNAMTFNFMSDGIPIVYYGQEQGFSGIADPWNREPLWPSGYQNGTTYQVIAKLNQLRNYMVNGTSGWLHQPAQLLTTSPWGIAIMKGDVISIMTTVGSPPNSAHMAVYSPWPGSASTIDVLSCTQYAVGSQGTIDISYSKGGQPVVLVRSQDLDGSGICTQSVEASLGGAQRAGVAQKSAASFVGPSALFFSLFSGLLLSLWFV